MERQFEVTFLKRGTGRISVVVTLRRLSSRITEDEVIMRATERAVERMKTDGYVGYLPEQIEEIDHHLSKQ